MALRGLRGGGEGGEEEGEEKEETDHGAALGFSLSIAWPSVQP
jgi:hypothetical protein